MILTTEQVSKLEELGFNKTIWHIYNHDTKKQTTRTKYRKLYNRGSYGMNGGCIDYSQALGLQTFFIEGNCEALSDLAELRKVGLE